jgi:hypothetical protein
MHDQTKLAMLRGFAEQAFHEVIDEMAQLGHDIMDCRCDRLTAAIKLWGEHLAMFRAEQPDSLRRRHVEIRQGCLDRLRERNVEAGARREVTAYAPVFLTEGREWISTSAPAGLRLTREQCEQDVKSLRRDSAWQFWLKDNVFQRVAQVQIAEVSNGDHC